MRGQITPDSSVVRAGHVRSMRLESEGRDAAAESAPIKLEIGQRYELTAWIRTAGLEVEQNEGAPVAVGATVSLASMPFDVHSTSLGGTRDWTRVRLAFTATRDEDRIVLAAGAGSRVKGQAWFDSVSVERIAGTAAPAEEAVETFGPAYRYGEGGWIHLHIEGEPYARGYQHGRLMAAEIPDYIERLAQVLDWKSPERSWQIARTTARALFLRGFDPEILQEMKGIADGAKEGGAKWRGRPVDLTDIVAANSFIELETLGSAALVTPNGLEGLKLIRPSYAPKPVPEHCSAFAATGKATRDGRMVIGHITMWGLRMAEASNVMLDIRPAAGHRVLMQSYPGGIESGLDWYQNDAGVVLTETTIAQTPFNIHGAPVASRARKAIQYGGNVDGVVAILGRDNNGLYTNEWLIGDAKTNEIAMFELGTNKTRLWRSSRGEWFGGTEGFYWGCNNTKDLAVRLENYADPKSGPAYIPFVPSGRDLKWQELYRMYRGRIDEQFGFLAFRTAPIVSSSSMDAKVATAAMASRMMVWGVFGKPNGREWVPASWDHSAAGLYSGGYHLIEALPAAPAGKPASSAPPKSETKKNPYKDRLWEGWILPASDADTWLAAGSAEYHSVLESDDWDSALAAARAGYTAARLAGDVPLRSLVATPSSSDWFRLASRKGALLLDALRREMGDDKFLGLMRGFFEAHAGRPVTTAEFIEEAEKAAGKPLGPFFSRWLEGTNIEAPPAYAAGTLKSRLAKAILVYGTAREAEANRYAAGQLQSRFLDWFESPVPVRKDFEVSDEDLKNHDVVLVGRPETNSVLEAWRARLALDYNGAAFRLSGTWHPGESEALVWTAANPLDPASVVVVIAGNSPLETVRTAKETSLDEAGYELWRAGKRVASGF